MKNITRIVVLLSILTSALISLLFNVAINGFPAFGAPVTDQTGTLKIFVEAKNGDKKFTLGIFGPTVEDQLNGSTYGGISLYRTDVIPGVYKIFEFPESNWYVNDLSCDTRTSGYKTEITIYGGKIEGVLVKPSQTTTCDFTNGKFFPPPPPPEPVPPAPPGTT